MSRTTGLVLGKFAPLHAGHQLLIERALAETDHVIVLIYGAANVTDVPLSVRSDWIRALYPAVEVREAWDGPTVVGDSPEIIKLHDDYITAKLADVRITHFYSSEFYGDHVSRALGAIDVRVDPERRTVPVSGSAIRNDAWAHRQFVAPVVYRDLVLRVAFVGAPSTGKSTITEALAREYGTTFMPEYGREYWFAHQVNRRLTPEQLVELAHGHREREELAMREARHVLFVDTEALVTRMYGIWYHGQVLPELERLADESASRYDVFFLCDDDIPYEDEWARSGDAFRTTFQQVIIDELLRRRIPYVTLTGPVDARVATVRETLRGYRKWTSFGDHLRGRRAVDRSGTPSAARSSGDAG